MNTLRPPERLETERLLLRPFSVDDAYAEFHGAASSATATRYMTFARHQFENESVRWVERCVRCWQDSSAFPWVVLLRSTGENIGNIELRLNPPRADFGYIYSEQFWGQGFATEAARAVVDWTIAQPEIFRVWATCHPDNLPSARVLQKAGLTFEARLENWEARPQLGELAGPSLMFSLIKPVRRIAMANARR